MVSRTVSVFSIFIIFFAVYSYYDNPLINSVLQSIFFPKSLIEKKLETGEIIFTKKQLAQYDGVKKSKMYLCIMGEVFDVTKGSQHYGKDSPYNVFIGQDATRSFVTGKFNTEEITDIVHDMNFADLRSVNHWVQFYRKDYTYVGKLIGRYYDENGQRTRYGERVWGIIEEAEKEKVAAEDKKKQFPPCNIEWTAESGSRVWCSEKSGGIERKWAGYPRQLYEPETHTFRCTCVENYKTISPSLKDYEGCDIQASSCYVKKDEIENNT